MTGPEKVRLSLDPTTTRQGAVDGAWWPTTYDAGAELPALIAAIDQHLQRRVLRVGLHIDTWDNIPHHSAAPGRHVKVGWFRTIDPHVVNLITRGSSTSACSSSHPTPHPPPLTKRSPWPPDATAVPAPATSSPLQTTTAPPAPLPSRS
jgi:hypothetical protein